MPEPGGAGLQAEQHADFQCLGVWKKRVARHTDGRKAIGRIGRVRGLRGGDSELKKVADPPKCSEWDSRSPKRDSSGNTYGGGQSKVKKPDCLLLLISSSPAKGHYVLGDEWSQSPWVAGWPPQPKHSGRCEDEI